MRKLYYLYRMSLGKTEWYFDDSFKTKEETERMAVHNSKNSSWKTWKIEEVLEHKNLFVDYFK